MELLFDQNLSHRLVIEARLRRNADELTAFQLDGTSAVLIIE